MNTLKATHCGRICILRIPLFLALIFSTSSCSQKTSMKPDFDTALKQHFAAITNRDIEAFKAHLTRGDTLYTIVQNGYAFTTPAEAIAIHEQWFKDPKWSWEGKASIKSLGIIWPWLSSDTNTGPSLKMRRWIHG